MNEKTLLKVAMVCSILGLGLLGVFSATVPIEAIDVSKVDGAHSVIKVYGTVSSVRNVGENQVIEVTQLESIEVFVGGKATVQRGDVVEVVGTIDEYNSKQQIVGERIRVVHVGGDA
jgi:hypothetical protein